MRVGFSSFLFSFSKYVFPFTVSELFYKEMNDEYKMKLIDCLFIVITSSKGCRRDFGLVASIVLVRNVKALSRVRSASFRRGFTPFTGILTIPQVSSCGFRSLRISWTWSRLKFLSTVAGKLWRKVSIWYWRSERCWPVEGPVLTVDWPPLSSQQHTAATHWQSDWRTGEAAVTLEYLLLTPSTLLWIHST